MLFGPLGSVVLGDDGSADAPVALTAEATGALPLYAPAFFLAGGVVNETGIWMDTVGDTVSARVLVQATAAGTLPLIAPVSFLAGGIVRATGYWIDDPSLLAPAATVLVQGAAGGEMGLTGEAAAVVAVSAQIAGDMALTGEAAGFIGSIGEPPVIDVNAPQSGLSLLADGAGTSLVPEAASVSLTQDRALATGFGPPRAPVWFLANGFVDEDGVWMDEVTQ
ncbi:hypothetical protein [Hyphomonas sp.]|jgi:hypothetical protein|uniref:hypothetical protein n=1 Tax=Hyphomonas sp. TaxID=87 RepID=UPI0037BEAA2D